MTDPAASQAPARSPQEQAAIQAAGCSACPHRPPERPNSPRSPTANRGQRRKHNPHEHRQHRAKAQSFRNRQLRNLAHHRHSQRGNETAMVAHKTAPRHNAQRHKTRRRKPHSNRTARQPDVRLLCTPRNHRPGSLTWERPFGSLVTHARQGTRACGSAGDRRGTIPQTSGVPLRSPRTP